MRWWTEPETSLRMLELVDDSDMEQGVATCVLGYHGLVAGVLSHLSKETLVDPGLVAASAGLVDIAPVAKALGRATSEVLGASSGRYGELLAKSIHSQAIADTARLVTTLALTVPMPYAVDRAVAIHGVPISKAGRYAFSMKAPVVAEVVKADLADRALMVWARDVARRERGPSRGSGYDRTR